MALSQHWIAHIEGWQRSGLSQAAYCRQHNLNANSFTGRLSEFRKQAKHSTPELIPVQVSTDKTSPTMNQLVLQMHNCRLELPGTVSAPWIAELLQCLR